MPLALPRLQSIGSPDNKYSGYLVDLTTNPRRLSRAEEIWWILLSSSSCILSDLILAYFLLSCNFCLNGQKSQPERSLGTTHLGPGPARNPFWLSALLLPERLTWALWEKPPLGENCWQPWEIETSRKTEDVLIALKVSSIWRQFKCKRTRAVTVGQVNLLPPGYSSSPTPLEWIQFGVSWLGRILRNFLHHPLRGPSEGHSGFPLTDNRRSQPWSVFTARD